MTTTLLSNEIWGGYTGAIRQSVGQSVCETGPRGSKIVPLFRSSYISM